VPNPHECTVGNEQGQFYCDSSGHIPDHGCPYPYPHGEPPPE
jgi:hypothetical protein